MPPQRASRSAFLRFRELYDAPSTSFFNPLEYQRRHRTQPPLSAISSGGRLTRERFGLTATDEVIAEVDYATQLENHALDKPCSLPDKTQCLYHYTNYIIDLRRRLRLDPDGRFTAEEYQDRLPWIFKNYPLSNDPWSYHNDVSRGYRATYIRTPAAFSQAEDESYRRNPPYRYFDESDEF